MFTCRELRSTVTPAGAVELSVTETEIAPPELDEVVVRIEHAPVNPSDLILLLAGADPCLASRAAAGILSARLPSGWQPALAARVGLPLPVGNEGAGVVVAAGPSPVAQTLLGRSVAVWAGGMYATLRKVRAAQCLLLPSDASAKDGASAHVNPLTALCMLESMRREGHKALIHTAAGSSLGHMLMRLCADEGVDLVNIVRRPLQAAELRALGSRYVCDSSAPDFARQLDEAAWATGATLAFDAIGGGDLAGQLLWAMEQAALRRTWAFDRYGSSVRKQVYIYGLLDQRPTVLPRDVGFAWGVGGWLVSHAMARLDEPRVARLKRRIVQGLTTTFATSYCREIGLEQMLEPDVLIAVDRRGSGGKHLLSPQFGA